MAVLEVKGLVGGYGKVPVINDVRFQAALSQVVTVVGPNGAGKSTSLKATFGLVSRHAGQVLLDGEDVSGLPSHLLARAGLGYVPQVDNVFATMTVEENLQLGALHQRSGLSQRRDEVFELFPDLAKARQRKGGQLSGGQRNMLGMARALMSDPKVMLLDEPTAGLSPANVDAVWSQIRRIAELGTSVVVVEQNVDRALQQADWVYVLVAGRNYLDGSPAALASVDLGAIFLGATHPAESGTTSAAGATAAESQNTTNSNTTTTGGTK